MPNPTPFAKSCKQKISVTVDEPVWRLVQELADATGETASAIVNYYLGEHSAEMAKMAKKYRASSDNQKLPL